MVNLSRKFGRKIQCQICGTSTYTKRKLEEYISEEEKNAQLKQEGYKYAQP